MVRKRKSRPTNGITVEKACQEYNTSVQKNLSQVNANVESALEQNYVKLEELAMKIEARTRFLENHPKFLSNITYEKSDVQAAQLREFTEIKITLKENCRRIEHKLAETEKFHRRLLELVGRQAVPFVAATPPRTDIKRRRPIADLHSKLIKQIKHTDSLEGFKEHLRRTNPNLQSQYEGSLWFFHGDQPKTTNKKSPRITPRRSIGLVRSDTKHSLKYYDLLDDIDTNLLQPIKAEYPRKDITYLHKITNQEQVLRKLLQPDERQKINSLMSYLTEPRVEPWTNTITAFPVKVITKHTNPEREPLATPSLRPCRKTTPPKVILEHLKGLKARNDSIQRNIQKAIDVIETKMIDLLSTSMTADNSAAFTAMESEITNVLKMMNDKPQERMVPEKDSSPTRIKTVRKRDNRKVADIEEGERLLTQVDCVIKNIDRMYTKLYDKNGVAEKENVGVLEFFDGLKEMAEEMELVPVTYRELEGVARIWGLANGYGQWGVYYAVKMEKEKRDWWKVGGVGHERALKVVYGFLIGGLYLALSLDYTR